MAILTKKISSIEGINKKKKNEKVTYSAAKSRQSCHYSTKHRKEIHRN